MLSNESPLAKVGMVVEVCDANLNTPVVLVVNLNMPVHPNRAHVMGAVEQRGVVPLRF